eukprot:GHVS01040162.1.p1 GENE.GHVS01040162.1~~GHVS01040162.1.p1  ORF type:complete len:250 (+),score=46.91 GHVS01040162.1:139-888(+)
MSSVPSRGSTALIIVDVQEDFLPPSGSLSVGPAGLQIIPRINRLKASNLIEHVAFTADWHLPDHISFAASHTPSAAPFTSIYVDAPTSSTPLPPPSPPTHHGLCSDKAPPPAGSVSLRVWPVHCVQYTRGSCIHQDVYKAKSEPVFPKGVLRHVESFSGFGQRPEDTGLLHWLRARGVARVVVVGLCTDHCVGLTALDAAMYGFDSSVVLEACAHVAEDTNTDMITRFSQQNVATFETVDDAFIDLKAS